MIKVLVVDDSVVFREMLRKGLNKHDNIEVVATARDPFEARDMLLKHRPNVMVCDIEMPKMDGITFITKLLPQYPIPTIVISSLDNGAFDAMEAGAVDFVGKVAANTRDLQEKFVDEIATKVVIAHNSKVVINKKSPSVRSNVEKKSTDEKSKVINRGYGKDYNKNIDVIAIGASTGGTEAIASIMKKLPTNIPGIVIVQHIPPMFSNMFANRMDACTDFIVKEAVSGDEIKPGTVLVAPGDKHMRVRKKGNKYIVVCEEGPKVSGHCPSVDVLFESVAQEVGNKAVGVILTGMGADGAKGMYEMKEKGAKTIGQDQASSIVYGMPKEAYDIGAVQKQAGLESIPKTILEML